MRNKTLSLLAAFAFTVQLDAQVSFGGRPYAFDHPSLLQTAPVQVMPQVDVARLMAEDEDQIASGVKGPWRFGYNHLVDLDLQNSGSWTALENGDRIWQLSIECPGAYSINFEFHDYVVPEGAQVFVYNTEGEHLGAFTQESSGGQHSMGVTQIAGERITIEYHEPASVAGLGSLRIGQVTHAYRDVLGKMRGLGDSGSCNRNVICPQGDLFRDQIRSVAMITVGGSGMCTGQLINNCENDGTPYFLTANHCVFGSVSNWIFRFNWDSPQCNQNLNGPTNQTVSGSSLKVQNATSDVALLELNAIPPASYNVFYTGWDRSTTPASSVVAIHHPSGDIKKISHEDQPVSASNQSGGTTGALNYWKVAAWDDGTTEGGSSGSGLWSQTNGLLIGQLYGGQASCSFNFNDYYGRFNVSYPFLDEWLGDCGMQLQGWPDSSTSIEVSEHANDVLVSPNPTNGLITISLPSGASIGSIRVIDALGQVVKEEQVRNSNNQLDLSTFNDGLYFIEVQTSSFKKVERLVLGH
jgi:hypothetical protein